tara:strand:+ start:23124 stop:23591 length:468 start_codon:yes stop_codon:yes gene_type:complete
MVLAVENRIKWEYDFESKYSKSELQKNKRVMNSSHDYQGRWQSGLMHQTVNLAAKAFGGSNPSLPTAYFSDFSGNWITNSKERYAVVAQLVEHQPSKLRVAGSSPVRRSISWGFSFWANTIKIAYVAQSVEHVLGKDEVTGSIPVVGSMPICQQK